MSEGALTELLVSGITCEQDQITAWLASDLRATSSEGKNISLVEAHFNLDIFIRDKPDVVRSFIVYVYVQADNFNTYTQRAVLQMFFEDITCILERRGFTVIEKKRR